MPKDIQLKKAHRDIFADQDSSWMALDLPEIKPPIYSKAFILFLSAFLVTAVIYSSVTEVPVVVESAGKLATMKPAVPIRAGSNFTVDSLLVKENQVVRSGTVLVASAEGFKPEEMQMVVELGKQLEYINSQTPLNQCNNCFPAIQKSLMLTRRLSHHKIASQVLKPVLEGCVNLGEIMLKLKQVDDRLSPVRARLAQLVTGDKSGRMPASVSNASLMAAANGPHKAEIQKLQNQLLQQYAPYMDAIQRTRSVLVSNTKNVASALDEMSKLTGVRAPFDGKIVNIRLKGAGEMVGGGQPVMEIVPTDNRIVAYIEVLNKDLGSIHVGDEVEVSVDAYPELDYGVLKGHIHEILPAEANNEPSMYGQERGFKVRVVLASQEMQSGGNTYPLLSGMTVRARTMKKQETLLRTFYRTIFRIKEDIRVRS